MNIGFDLDKVLIDFPPFIPAKLIEKRYKEKSNGVLLYRIPGKPEQLIRFLTHLPPFRPPIKKNIAFVKNLAAKNTDKHYLISSRFGFLKKITYKLVTKHGLDKVFEKMFFNFSDQQPHVFKDAIIKKQKIELYVDDDLPLLEYLAKRNPGTKFFWLNDKEDKELASNLFAITELASMI